MRAGWQAEQQNHVQFYVTFVINWKYVIILFQVPVPFCEKLLSCIVSVCLQYIA